MPRLLQSLVGCVLLVALGVGAIMYADHDDAPGLGLIGFVLILDAIALGVRAVLRAKRDV
ncbi:hypothetical protein ACIRG5_35165 [Lentzea sp. NPDC102401]|uniref:hypothetical protein n=1 Tax=Lentzea sp. NPDC102401 TaxID=3364128 RepID=UPI0038080308